MVTSHEEYACNLYVAQANRLDGADCCRQMFFTYEYSSDMIKCHLVGTDIRYGREQCENNFCLLFKPENLVFITFQEERKERILINKAIYEKNGKKKNESTWLKLIEIDRANNNAPAQCNSAIFNDIDQFFDDSILFCSGVIAFSKQQKKTYANWRLTERVVRGISNRQQAADGMRIVPFTMNNDYV